MKTMQNLINRFNRLNPNYSAYLDPFDSRAGWYVIYVSGGPMGLSARHFFSTCAEFRDWMDGVILD